MSDTDVEVIIEDETVPKEDRKFASFSEIIDTEQLKELMKYLKTERQQAIDDWRVRNDKLREWRNNLEAFANKGPKNTPMKGSSNVKTPLTQMITQGLYAKSKGSLSSREPFWTCSSITNKKEDVDHASIITKYMSILANSKFDLDLDPVLTDSELTKVLDGTAIHKVLWERTLWNFKERDEVAGAINTEISYLRDGPTVMVVPLENFLHKKGARDIYRTKWVSHELDPFEEWELEELGNRGTYQNVDELIEKVGATKDLTDEQKQRNEFDSTKPDNFTSEGYYQISEFYVYEDIDGDGISEEIIVTAHADSMTVLRVDVNSLGFRPFVSTRHVPRAFTYTGRGTGQLVEGHEDEATAVHNLRLDNMKIANMRVIVASTSADFGPVENIYPGKVIRTNTPKEDVQSFQLGEIYPSAERAEMISQQYAQKVTGLSDTQMGFADQVLKSRDTARGQAMRMQAGNSILEDIQQSTVSSWGQIGMMVFLQLVANRETVVSNEQRSKRLKDEEIGMLEQALNIPVKEIPRRLTFTVEMTDVEHTFEVRRQNTLTLVQLYAQWAEQSFPLVQALFGPNGQQMLQAAPKMYHHMMKLYTGSAKLMEDVFEFFGKQNSSDYVPDMEANDRMLEMIEQMTGMLGQAKAMNPGMITENPQERNLTQEDIAMDQMSEQID